MDSNRKILHLLIGLALIGILINIFFIFLFYNFNLQIVINDKTKVAGNLNSLDSYNTPFEIYNQKDSSSESSEAPPKTSINLQSAPNTAPKQTENQSLSGEPPDDMPNSEDMPPDAAGQEEPSVDSDNEPV